jgi:hypothetical protein
MSDNYYSVAIAITTSDTTDATAPYRGIYVGGTGDVKIRSGGLNGATSDVVFKAVPVGTILRVKAIRVFTTGTTATNLVGLY